MSHMIQIIGFVIVLAVVFGGLMVSGGPAIMSALPFELALIGGAAFGTVLIGNAPSVARQAIVGFVTAIRGPKWQRNDYTNLLTTLHELMRLSRRGGMIAIEQDIEDPQNSELFGANPRLVSDPDAIGLICDSFRLMAIDPSTASRAGQQTEDTIAGIIETRHRAVAALQTLADALPALGIVAAVLGIIKTMGMIDQSTAVLGEMIAAAMLGTFLGVFLAYGLVGPIASRLGQVVDEDAAYLDVISQVITFSAQGLAPRTAIELARSAIPADHRPAISSLDIALTANRFKQSKAAA